MKDFNLTYETRTFSEIVGLGLTIEMHYDRDQQNWEVHYSDKTGVVDCRTFVGNTKQRPYMDVLVHGVRNILKIEK